MKTFSYTVELSTEGDASHVADALAAADKAIRRAPGGRTNRFNFRRDPHRANRLTVSLHLTASNWVEASTIGGDALRDMFARAGLDLRDADQPRPTTDPESSVEARGYELASAR